MKASLILATCIALLLDASHALAQSAKPSDSGQDPIVLLFSAAIERGVPQFNGGDPNACAAIYATAIDAVLLGKEWGLSLRERTRLEGGMEAASRLGDASARAWAYRGLMDELLEPRLASMMRDGRPPMEVFTFDSPEEARRWRVVVDGVMGGRSTGMVEASPGTMVFRGETSLANNGGFSSIRVPIRQGALTGYDIIRMRVKGDGRTYIVGARSQGGMGGDSFWFRFRTAKDTWQTIDVPISKMERHFFGQRRAGEINASQIAGLEFYIYDKKAGPFKLEVDSIQLVQDPPELDMPRDLL